MKRGCKTLQVLTLHETQRYARHITLPEIGGQGQQRLQQARVLVIGVGGLGAPVALYLAMAGVGQLMVCDDGRVDLPDLQRQIMYREQHIGQAKADIAQAVLQQANPFIRVRGHNGRITSKAAASLFPQYDLIIDTSDNAATRNAVNKIAVHCRRPLLSAAITGWEGQISLYDTARGAPCYACVFPQAKDTQAFDCAGAGVVAAVPGVVGTMLAVECIKEIVGVGAGLRGQLMLYDGLYGEHRRVRIARMPHCSVCGDGK